MAVAILALHLMAAGAVRAEDDKADPAKPGIDSQDDAKDDAKGDDKDDAKEDGKGDKKDDDKAEDAPGTRNLELTGFQCEALALGRTIKDLPADAKVEAMTFGEPQPVTYQLPTQRRDALTECSLRASGLTVRVDKTRNAIILLPSGTGSPDMPNPKIKVILKLAEAPEKADDKDKEEKPDK